MGAVQKVQSWNGHTPKLRHNLYPVYTIKQTSSNHRTNIKQMHSKSTCTTCAL